MNYVKIIQIIVNILAKKNNTISIVTKHVLEKYSLQLFTYATMQLFAVSTTMI